MHPDFGHRLTMAALTLRNFIFVMRENEIQSAPMDIKSLSQKATAHRRTFDMPTRSSPAPGALPERLSRFGRFPECKICSRTFLGGRPSSFTLQVIHRPIGQLAIFRIVTDIEKHISLHLIGKLPLDERFSHFDDFSHAFGGPRHVIDQIDPHTLEIFQIICHIFFGNFRQRLAELLGVPATAVGLKAKTGEGVGPVGRKEAISAECVVLLEGTE